MQAMLSGITGFATRLSVVASLPTKRRYILAAPAVASGTERGAGFALRDFRPRERSAGVIGPQAARAAFFHPAVRVARFFTAQVSAPLYAFCPGIAYGSPWRIPPRARGH